MVQTSKRLGIILVAIVSVFALFGSVMSFMAPTVLKAEDVAISSSDGTWYLNDAEYKDEKLVYDKTAKVFTLRGITLPEGIALGYEYYSVDGEGSETLLESAPIDVGSYIVKVKAPDGYAFSDSQNTSKKFTIDKAVVSRPVVEALTPQKKQVQKVVSAIVSDSDEGDSEATGEGSEENADDEEPTVTYITYEIWSVDPQPEGSELYTEVAVEGEFEAIKKGDYEITYVFALKDKHNYVFQTEGLPQGDWVSSDGTRYTMTLKWQAPEDLLGVPYVNGGITVVDTDDNIKEGFNLNVTQTSDININDYRHELKAKFANSLFEFGNAYDIHFEDVDGNRLTEYNGTFRVEIPLEEALASEEKFAVIHIKDDGNIEFVDNVAKNGNTLQFNTGSFSVYVLVVVKDAPAPAGSWWLIALIAALAVLVVLAVVFIVLNSKGKNGGQKSDKTNRSNN